jgi:hypothetical protein
MSDKLRLRPPVRLIFDLRIAKIVNHVPGLYHALSPPFGRGEGIKFPSHWEGLGEGRSYGKKKKQMTSPRIFLDSTPSYGTNKIKFL